MSRYLRMGVIISGLAHGLVITYGSAYRDETIELPTAAGITLTSSAPGARESPDLPGDSVEVAVQRITPEATRTSQQRAESILPARRVESTELVVIRGELPPPNLSRTVMGEIQPSEELSQQESIPRQPPQPASVPSVASAPIERAVGTTDEELPLVLANPPPIYPVDAQRAGRQGTVILELAIGIEGDVEAIRVARSSGHQALDAEAHRAVRAWRFRPAQSMGQPIAMNVRLPIHFRLE